MKQRIKLEDIKPNSQFEVPERYFDTLPLLVQTRIYEQKARKEQFRLSWSWRRTAVWASAASIVGALLWVTYPQKQYSLGQESLSQVSNEAIVDYLKDNNITNQDLAEQLPIEELYPSDDALLQNLNVDEESLQNALENEDIEI